MLKCLPPIIDLFFDTLSRIVPRHDTVHAVLIILILVAMFFGQSNALLLVTSLERDTVVFVVGWSKREMGLRGSEGG